MASGELAELFGSEVLAIDKFMRAIRVRSAASETAKTLNKDSLDTLQAYADGVNDYVSGVKLSGED